MKYEKEPYYFSLLTKFEQSIYLELLDSMVKFRKRTELTRWGINLEELNKLFFAVCLDHPEIIWLSWENLVYMQPEDQQRGGKAKVMAVEYTYTMTRQEAGKKMRQIDLAAAPLIRRMAGSRMSDWERVLWLHDALIHGADYDDAEKRDHKVRHENHSIFGTLVKREAVCEGYAEAMTYILRQIGIDCITCVGGGNWSRGKNPAEEIHAWNCVTIDGCSMQIDVTWDDLGNSRKELGITYQYFGLTGREMALCHGCGSFLPLPECDCPGMNYFVHHKLMVNDLDQVRQLVGKAVKERKGFVEMRVGSTGLLQQMMERDRQSNPLWLPPNCREIIGYRWYKPNEKLGWARIDFIYS